jgi:spermidine/putrescine transport system ATP-binding protein
MPSMGLPASPPKVELRNVSKRFGSYTAVDNITLAIGAGEFLTLLGPSGCGKTTLLRMISGFETPTEGAVILNGQDVTHFPPYRRDVNQVFQSYALFPHLSVADNIAFGLKMKKVSRDEIRQRVTAAADLVSLTGMEDRKPGQLSGGQRQRVALARAIVLEPQVLLLDEPLSALDAKLRHAMQIELKRLQKMLGITFVFVTHDQDEALTMSDRIAVINQGKVEQLGSAAEIYHKPRTTFVANFIGQANILQAQLVRHDGAGARVTLEGGIELQLDATDLPADPGPLLISIRPEKIHLQRPQPQTASGDNTFAAKVIDEIFRGAVAQLHLETAGGLRLTAMVANESVTQQSFHPGDTVWCHLHRDDIVVVQG